jgi:hypothetical protein
MKQDPGLFSNVSLVSAFQGLLNSKSNNFIINKKTESLRNAIRLLRKSEAEPALDFGVYFLSPVPSVCLESSECSGV